MSKNLIPRYHVLTRSGFVGEYAPAEQPGTLLPPGMNAAGECPAHGDCSLCWTAEKCTKRRELLANEERDGFLLPAQYHTGDHRPGMAGQNDYDPGTLLPPGVE